MIDLLEEIHCHVDVLDHGFIKLVDVMPRIRCQSMDQAIVQAARVSYGKGTKTVSEDRGLIRYLMRHRHTTPFEMCEFKFHIKAPIFVARQWVRHRTASWNEVSGRYSELPAEYHIPEELRANDGVTKQTSSAFDFPEDHDTLGTINRMDYECSSSFRLYDDLIKWKVAREQARICLPLATYTEWYWKINLHNLLHFLSLRMDQHAQEEIRVYANQIGKWVGQLAPDTWQAFVDFRLLAMTITGPERRAMINGGDFISVDNVTEREKKEWKHKQRLF